MALPSQMWTARKRNHHPPKPWLLLKKRKRRIRRRSISYGSTMAESRGKPGLSSSALWSATIRSEIRSTAKTYLLDFLTERRFHETSVGGFDVTDRQYEGNVRSTSQPFGD